MAKRKDKSSVVAQPTATNQTRGLTDTQRLINSSTGVDRNYNYNKNSAAGSASALAQTPVGFENWTDKARKKWIYNFNRRKSNGGSGG